MYCFDSSSLHYSLLITHYSSTQQNFIEKERISTHQISSVGFSLLTLSIARINQMSLLHSRRAASNLVNGGQTAQVVRRGRRKRVAADEGSFLSLKDFMHRQRVLKQYREFVRTTYKMPSDDASWKSQILTEIRETYRSRMNETDKLSISMAVTDVSVTDFLFKAQDRLTQWY